ncbi:MAG: amidohydrolase family protein [Bacteroidota bacterium]
MTLSATYIFHAGQLLQNHVLELDENGLVLNLRPVLPTEDVAVLDGILCPGFVNAHCHLELTAFGGKIPEGTGMVGFVRSLMTARREAQLSVAIQEEAVHKAMREMWQAGTVLVGDICNGPISLSAKKAFPQLHTHSFIEILGLAAEKAEEILANGNSLAQQFGDLPHSLSPHAPYSMSAALLEKVYATRSQLFSIHLLESMAERQLFEQGNGPFLDFYRSFGIPFQTFSDQKTLDHITKNLPAAQSVLWVHNTEMQPDEYDFLIQHFSHSYFCLCPRSNQFIHGKKADLKLFQQHPDHICLGTDSLASNHSLDVFAEAVDMHLDHPDLPLTEVLSFLTINGAKALQQANVLGDFSIGKQPGVNLIQHPDWENFRLTNESRVRKIL